MKCLSMTWGRLEEPSQPSYDPMQFLGSKATKTMLEIASGVIQEAGTNLDGRIRSRRSATKSHINNQVE